MTTSTGLRRITAGDTDSQSRRVRIQEGRESLSPKATKTGADSDRLDTRGGSQPWWDRIGGSDRRGAGTTDSTQSHSTHEPRGFGSAVDGEPRVSSDSILARFPSTRPDAGLPENATADQASEFLRATPPASQDPAAWTEDQRRAFNTVGQDFGARHGPHHVEWHLQNGPGGTQGPGSGERFLEFHHGMMNDFERETGVAVPTGWDPSTPVPSELRDPAGPRTRDDADVFTPSWLTTDGTGTASGNQSFGSTVVVDGKTFGKLGDFENPDQLGRALGESGYHASVHVNLGGTMDNIFEAPRDPAFYLWHGHIEGIVDRWLETDNGRAWATANPGDPLLDPDHSAMSSHVSSQTPTWLDLWLRSESDPVIRV